MCNHLTTGNFFNNGIYKSDYQCFDEERKLIDKVFDNFHTKWASSIIHTSLIWRRPIFSHIEQSKNVELVSSNKISNFSFRANPAINTGVSSTFTLLIFRHSSDLHRFKNWRLSSSNEQTRNSERISFLFWCKSSDFHDHLRLFLSKDIKEIRHLWNFKSITEKDLNRPIRCYPYCRH